MASEYSHPWLALEHYKSALIWLLSLLSLLFLSSLKVEYS
jgi:hypothetical protein